MANDASAKTAEFLLKRGNCCFGPLKKKINDLLVLHVLSHPYISCGTYYTKQSTRLQVVLTYIDGMLSFFVAQIIFLYVIFNEKSPGSGVLCNAFVTPYLIEYLSGRICFGKEDAE